MTLLLIASGTLFLVLIAIHIYYRLYKLNQVQKKNIVGLQNQLATLFAGAVGTDERIIHFEQNLHQLKEYQNTLNLGTPAQHNYDHAIRLARKGVDTKQLIDNCNLSDEEAHLISRLHGESTTVVNPDLH